MKYYLFTEKGINDPKHIEKLESLLNGVMVEKYSSFLDYLNALEKELSTKKLEETLPNIKVKSRVLSSFKKGKK